MNKWIELAITFLKIGTFNFGGGYGMIPMIQMETVDIHQWISAGRLVDLIAISQSTPGPIAVNIATYIGYHQGQLLGSLTATLAVTLPSFIISGAIGTLKKNYGAVLRIEDWMIGIRPAAVGLILAAIYIISKRSIVHPAQLIIAGIVFGLCVKTQVKASYILAGSALVGIVSGMMFLQGGVL